MKFVLRRILLLLGGFYLTFTKRPNQDFNKKYHNSIDKIDKLYSQKLYWHGTGRYQYSKNGKINDVLETIIKNRGLKPLVKDPWLETKKGYQKTISMAKIRQFASVYALIHQSEDEKLKYMHGTRFFWSLIVGLNNFLESPIDITKHAYSFTTQNRTHELIDFQSKARNKDHLRQYKNYVRQLMYMPLIRSDIPNNYAILFAIKKNSVEYIKLSSGFEYYEARTEEDITFEKISHIEVPIAKVKETEALLKRYAIEVPVIPIDYGELYVKKEKRIGELLSP